MLDISKLKTLLESLDLSVGKGFHARHQLAIYMVKLKKNLA